MLPFLKPRRTTTLMVGKIKPEGEMEEMGPEAEADPALISAAEDMISAMHAKDALALAKAGEAFFQICDAMPHVEGEHEEIE